MTDDTPEPDDTEPDPTRTIVAFDPESRVSVQVLTALAAIRDVDPVAMEQLSAVVDPEALDAMFADVEDKESDVHVQVHYVGYVIEIDSSGLIAIEPRSDEE